MNVKYYPLLDRMFKKFQVREDSVLQYQEPEAFDVPYITVAREPGSGGAPVAKRVAEKLNFLFVDEQIIDKISKSTRKRKAVIKEVDEKSRTRIEDIVHSALNKEYVDDVTYMRELVKIVLAYAYKGKVVILGRGANFICPFAKGLHVNVVAPYKVRVQRAMDYEGLTNKQAKKVIADVEKERKTFVKQYFKIDPKQANAYDLTINTTFFNIEQSADIITEAFFGKFPQTQLVKKLLK